MTPAERLLAAADQLDKLASGATPGPWVSHIGSNLHEDAAAWIGAPGAVTTDGVYIASTANHPDGLNDAAYIATMHPGVGKVLVAALRTVGETIREWDLEPAFQYARFLLPLADLLLAGGEQL